MHRATSQTNHERGDDGHQSNTVLGPNRQPPSPISFTHGKRSTPEPLQPRQPILYEHTPPWQSQDHQDRRHLFGPIPNGRPQLLPEKSLDSTAFHPPHSPHHPPQPAAASASRSPTPLTKLDPRAVALDVLTTNQRRPPPAFVNLQFRHRTDPNHTPPQHPNTPQDQLERLAAEASNVVGGISGTASDQPRRYIPSPSTASSSSSSTPSSSHSSVDPPVKKVVSPGRDRIFCLPPRADLPDFSDPEAALKTMSASAAAPAVAVTTPTPPKLTAHTALPVI